MRRPQLLLFAYRMMTRALTPVGGQFLQWRRRRGKEDPNRLGERMGIPGRPRPSGRLAWLHGASVGESLALLPLVDLLIARGFCVLVTTGTVTSAMIMAARLPARAIHQFVPIDLPAYVSRFLEHWRPDIVLVAESELWPNMIVEVSRRAVPLVLVNARMSQRSFTGWVRLPGFIGGLLRCVDLCLTQTQDDAGRLVRLGAPRVQVIGNLKFDVAPPSTDRAMLSDLSAQVGARPLWVAASTHEDEEPIILAVHQRLIPRFPSLVTIVLPRQVRRGDALIEGARSAGLVAAQRSKGEMLSRATQIYVADTMGEVGLFYRMSSVVFMGKSLAGGGGQNPIEPAKLGSAILHGPKVANFAEVYAALDDGLGATEVLDEEDLAAALTDFFSNAGTLRKAARAAADTVEVLGGASLRTMRALEPYLAQMMMERRA